MPVKTIAMKRLEGQKRTFYMDEHGGYQHEYVDFYPAELVEKIIEDLSNQVLEERKKWTSMFNHFKAKRKELRDALHAAIVARDKSLESERRQKHKRCLAMAELCRTSALYEKSLDASKYCKWWLKWYERWMELSEQFKDAKCR